VLDKTFGAHHVESRALGDEEAFQIGVGFEEVLPGPWAD